jgi:RNA recognition motif-containing protein
MWEPELTNLGTSKYTQDAFRDVTDNLDNVIAPKNGFKDVNIVKDELYLGNIHHDLVYEELYEFLSKFGELDFLNMIADNRGKSQGFAFAKFKNLAVHEKLIKQSNSYSLKGRKLVISEKIEKKQTLEDIERMCWFCINNPMIESELVLREFNDFYLAYPKGPITNFHFLVIPKHHIRGYLNLLDNQKKELDEILSKIKKLLSDNDLDYIIYEKNLPYKEEVSKHFILNIIGINKELSFNFLDLCVEYFNEKNLKFKEFDQSTSIERITGKDNYYYYMDIATGLQFGTSNVRTKLYLEVKGSSKTVFIDHPRILICNLLDSEERVNWKVNTP